MKLHKYIVVSLSLIMIVGCGPKGDTGGNPSSAQLSNYTAKGIPQVEVINPVKKSFTEMETITGNIVADQSVMLHSMEQGVVKAMYVDIGDRVSKGKVVATLSNPILNYEVKEAEVKLIQAKANRIGAEARINLSEVDYQAKQTIFQNIQKVYEQSKGLTTINELEKIKKDANVAQAQVEIDKVNLARYDAEINAANTMLEAIKVRHGMLSVRAPFSGVVTGRYADPGAMIQSALSDNGAKPLVSIESNDPVRLILPIPESAMSGIKVGDEVEINFPSLPNANRKSKITRIAKNLDASSKTMEVQIDLDNKNGDLQSGMYTKAKIKRNSSSDILALPHAAVLMRKDAPSVLVVENGIVREIKLKKGISGLDHFEVLNSDINANTQVILKGKSTVKAGQKVNASKKG